MGLAALLKRKLPPEQQLGAKRARLDGSTGRAAQTAVHALAAANSLVHRSSNSDSRSARRRQNKVARQHMLAAAQQQEQRHPAHRDAAASDSDGESERALLAMTGLGDPMGTADLPQAAVAYKALLSSLKSTSREFAQQRLEREREEAGLEDASETEEEEQGEREAGEEHAEIEGCSGDGERGISDQGAGGHIDAVNAAGITSSDTSENESGKAQEELESQDLSSDEDEDTQPDGVGQAGDDATVDSPAQQDCYQSHFDTELGEAEAAALQAGSSSASHFTVRSNADPELLQWQGVELQANDAVKSLPKALPQLAAYGVKERLATRWREAVLAPCAKQQQQQQEQQQEQHANGSIPCTRTPAVADMCEFVSAQQQALFALLSTYSDLLLPCRPYPTDADAPDPDMDAVLLHVLSHCAKAADRIKRNNDRINAAADAGTPLADPPRDQGFTRPKALILLPLRSSALRVVQRITQLAVKETRTDSVQGKSRLLDEFGGEDEEELPPRAAGARARRPAEHTALFSGNMDDHFRLGIKLTRGAVRLFADFYQSDILVASPMALATKLAERDEGAADFLSSIEIVVVQRADVLQMQNWEHVRTVFAALNRTPSQQHGADIMRVRQWALSGWGTLYRQTILLSSFASPEMNALLTRVCANYAGCFRLKPCYSGVLSHVVPQVRQVFERLQQPSPATIAAAAVTNAGTEPSGSVGALATDADARFDHFKRVVWPRLKEAGNGGGQLLYIPSYFDFVRVRNFLKSEAASFVVLSEYVEPSDAARARSYFFDRRRPLLLLTERAQFYHRYRIRGIKDILFYQLPEHPQFYAELLNLLEETEAAGTIASTHTLFSRLDVLRLERVVGSQRAAKMLKKGGTFLFC